MKTIDIINNAKAAVPDYLKDCPWADLEHGTKVLETEVQMNCYMAAYGWAHAAKAYWAIKKMFDYKEPECFEVFDWGCGQGIATTCLIDYLKEFGILDRLHKITLIEPSGAALQRAVWNVRNVLGNHLCRIEALQAYMPVRSDYPNEPVIEDIDIVFPESLHIFSNVLDLYGLDFKKIADILRNSGYINYVICTGPVFERDYMYRFYEEFWREEIEKEAECVADFKDDNFIADNEHKFSCRIVNFIIRCQDWKLMSRTPEAVFIMSGREILDENALVRYFRSEDGTPFFRLKEGVCLYVSRPVMQEFSSCKTKEDVIKAFCEMKYVLMKVNGGTYIPVLV